MLNGVSVARPRMIEVMSGAGRQHARISCAHFSYRPAPRLAQRSRWIAYPGARWCGAAHCPRYPFCVAIFKVRQKRIVVDSASRTAAGAFEDVEQ
jgi:hypothetical protein